MITYIAMGCSNPVLLLLSCYRFHCHVFFLISAMIWSTQINSLILSASHRITIGGLASLSHHAWNLLASIKHTLLCTTVIISYYICCFLYLLLITLCGCALGRLSIAWVFMFVVWFGAILIAFIVAYLSFDFWVPQHIYREQPVVTFQHKVTCWRRSIVLGCSLIVPWAVYGRI